MPLLFSILLDVSQWSKSCNYQFDACPKRRCGGSVPFWKFLCRYLKYIFNKLTTFIVVPFSKKNSILCRCYRSDFVWFCIFLVPYLWTSGKTNRKLGYDDAELQEIEMAKDWPCRSGRTPKTLRFDPSTSATSGLFVAKIRKLPPNEAKKNVLWYLAQKGRSVDDFTEKWFSPSKREMRKTYFTKLTILLQEI